MLVAAVEVRHWPAREAPLQSAASLRPSLAARQAQYSPFSSVEQPCIAPTLEGKTARQHNPHPPQSLAWLSWIITRLGGWNCYYKPPGPKTMHTGWAQFAAMAAGFAFATQSAV